MSANNSQRHHGVTSTGVSTFFHRLEVKRSIPIFVGAALLATASIAAADLSRPRVLIDAPLDFVVSFDDAVLAKAQVERENDYWWWRISQETIDDVGEDNDIRVEARHLRGAPKTETEAQPMELVLLNVQPGESKEDVIEAVEHPGGPNFDWVGLRYKAVVKGASKVTLALSRSEKKLKFPESGPPNWQIMTIIGIIIAGFAFYIVITLLRGREVE